VGKRSLLKNRRFVRAERDPDRLERSAAPIIAEVLRPLAAHAEQRAVDRPDDVRKSDLLRGPGQPESAIGPRWLRTSPALLN